MSRRFSSVLGGVLLSATLLLNAGRIFAATPGSGPANAAPLPAGFATINPGARIWYSFQYAGDASQILVDMNVPGGNADFSVWTQDELRSWVQGNAEDPAGRGTHDRWVHGDSTDNNTGDMIWDGSFDAPGTYYIAVDNSGTIPSTYSLAVSGSGIAVYTAPMTAARSMAPALAQHAAARLANGARPDTALALPAGRTISALGRTWYAFQYPGDNAQVMIDMNSDPGNRVGFSVWTAAELRSWMDGNGEDPVGQGTHNRWVNGDSTDNNTGDLVWDGTFDAPGTYYVAVDETGPSPIGYSLSVNMTGPAS